MLVDSVDLRVLPDLFAAAADRGDPVVLELPDEPPAYVYDLMRTLGVPVVVRPVSSALVNVDVRVAEGADGSIVILGAYCSRCKTESSPGREGRCSFCGTVIVDEDLLSAKEMRAQLAQPRPGRVNGTATANGASRPRRSYTRARSREDVLEQLRGIAEGLGHVPTRREAQQGGVHEYHAVKLFGSYANMVEAAGYPRPVRGKRTTRLAALSEREPKGREQLTSSAPASSHPGAGTPAGAVDGGSPRPLVGEPGSRSENAVLDAPTAVLVAELLRRVADAIDTGLFHGANLALIFDGLALETRRRLEAA